ALPISPAPFPPDRPFCRRPTTDDSASASARATRRATWPWCVGPPWTTATGPPTDPWDRRGPARPLADRARPPTQTRWWPPPRLGPLHRGRSASPPWLSAMSAWGQTPRPDGRRFALPTRRCDGDWFDWFD